MSFEVLGTSLIFWEALTFVLLVAVFLAFWARIKQFFEGWRGSPENAGGGRDPLKTLDERYANGEITREEYLTIRDDITRYPHA